MPLNTSVKSTVEKKIEEYEGRYNHLYLDTKNKVTVGVGHLITNKSAISSVTLYTVKNNVADKKATLAEKQTEYDNIAKQKKNYKASWYKQHTTLIIKPADIDTQKSKHISSFYTELTNIYKKTNGYTTDFDSFPEKVQAALFDMIFNLGATKLKNKFPNFNKAIKAENWTKAATESNRPDVNSARNTYVKTLFNNAAKASNTSTETTVKKK